MNENENNEELRERELISGLLSGVLDYCEGEYGPARDDLNVRLQKKKDNKELVNLLLQRLAWVAAIVGGAITAYNLVK